MEDENFFISSRRMSDFELAGMGARTSDGHCSAKKRCWIRLCRRILLTSMPMAKYNCDVIQLRCNVAGSNGGICFVGDEDSNEVMH